MRFFLSMQVGKQVPGSRALWEEGALKSVRRKTSLRHQVTSTAKDVFVVDSQGNTLKRLAVEVPPKLYDSVFGRTTRGLYFFHTERILDHNVQVQAVPLTHPPADTLLQPLQFAQIGGGAFSYWFDISVEEPSSSLWLYSFYESHWVEARTGSMCNT